MRSRLFLILCVIALATSLSLGSAGASPAPAPLAHAAATCADYPNQAAAQRAADTRDPDGDGVYCESLPCPCAGPGQTGAGGDAPVPTAPPSSTVGCARPTGVRPISFSKTKYPHIRRH